jgi:hypothetical protein
MGMNDLDELVVFQDVRVLRSTPPALLCQIGKRSVWLPRRHISGKLWCTGDRGKLFIRRWVARDRNLIDLHGLPVAILASSSVPRQRVQLRLVPRIRDTGPRG